MSLFVVGCGKSRARPSDDGPPDAFVPVGTTLKSAQGPLLERPDWLARLKEPERTDIPFTCDAVKVHRAWRFRAEAVVTPSANAELVAVHLTTRVTSGFEGAFLGEGGAVIDTSIEYARADARGAPVNRFYSKSHAPYGPVDLVAIGAVRKGTSKLTFRARPSRGDEVCDTSVALEEGPTWPALPRYEVTRFYRSKTGSLMLLYRASNVLPYESPAPTLTWRKKEKGISVAGPRPMALVAADESGEPAPYDPTAASRWIVAEYDGAAYDDAPTAYTAGDREMPLPRHADWRVSDALGAALDASMIVWQRFGDQALSVFFSTGQAGLTKAITDRSIYVQTYAYEPRRERR